MIFLQALLVLMLFVAPFRAEEKDRSYRDLFIEVSKYYLQGFDNDAAEHFQVSREFQNFNNDDFLFKLAAESEWHFINAKTDRGLFVLLRPHYYQDESRQDMMQDSNKNGDFFLIRQNKVLGRLHGYQSCGDSRNRKAKNIEMTCKRRDGVNEYTERLEWMGDDFKKTDSKWSVVKH